MRFDEGPVFLRLDKACVYLREPPAHRAPCAGERMHLRGKLSQVRGFIDARRPNRVIRVCRSCCGLHLCEDRRMAIASRGPRIADGQNIRRFGRNFEASGPHSGLRCRASGTIWPEVCQKISTGTPARAPRAPPRRRRQPGHPGGVGAIAPSSAPMTTAERSWPADRRPLHDDRSRSLQMLDQALGGDRLIADMSSSAL